jgi:hypothetical protein
MDVAYARGESVAARAAAPAMALDSVVVLDANFLWTRQLFGELASRVPVLFLEPRDLVTAWGAGWRPSTDYAFRQLGPNLEAKRYVFPPGWFSRCFAPFERLLAAEIRRWMDRRGVTRTGIAISYPHYAPVVRRVRPAASIYYWSDDFRSYWPSRRHRTAALEHAAVELTDLTMCASDAKARELAGEVPRSRDRIGVLIHGHHPALLAGASDRRPAELPADLAGLPRPIVGHWGHVSRHVDFEIVHAVAKALPGATLLFVGPIATDMGDEQRWFERCRALPNVRFAGPRPYDAVASIVPAFDVCLALYRPDQPFTRLTNPSKIRDYLATGRPIVTTALPDVVRYWSSMLRIGRTPCEFAAHVRDVLDGHDRSAEARLAFAREHTWTRAADRLWDAMNETAGRSTSGAAHP